MNLDLQRFYEACNPAEPIDMKNPEDSRYYIDFAAVRGDKVIKALKRVISRLSPNRPTCQLFTGHKGEQLRKINCHLIYTVPMVLIYANASSEMEQRLGGGKPTQVLPMVPTKLRNGEDFSEGMELLMQMVLTRAFPELTPKERSGLITEVFDSVETLNRLCRISGGHVRNLLSMLYSCLQEDDPPIAADTLESVIRSYRDKLLLNIDDKEWELLFEVDKTQRVKGEEEYQTLLASLFVFEYHDKDGTWFGLNPLLLETDKYRNWKA